eukprot:scaffold670564_cov80-Prasinocladus_malaysianus.AAC.1
MLFRSSRLAQNLVNRRHQKLARNVQNTQHMGYPRQALDVQRPTPAVSCPTCHAAIRNAR